MGDLSAQMFSSSPSGGSETMQLMYQLAITASKRSINLANSYFVPHALTIQTLVQAVRRGVKVRVISNFDNRSFRLNDEANLNVLNTQFGATQQRVFDENWAQSRRVTLAQWQDRPWRERVLELATLLNSQL